MEKRTKGTLNEQEGSNAVMSSLIWWVASPYNEGNYIPCHSDRCCGHCLAVTETEAV